MPARIVLALDEPGFAEQAAAVLNERGYEATALPDSMAALTEMEKAHSIELLVTCPNFEAGKPNGISLVLMARHKRPQLKVLFVGPSELERYTAGLGSYQPSPVTAAELIEAAVAMLTMAELPDRSH